MPGPGRSGYAGLGRHLGEVDLGPRNPPAARIASRIYTGVVHDDPRQGILSQTSEAPRGFRNAQRADNR